MLVFRGVSVPAPHFPTRYNCASKALILPRLEFKLTVRLWKWGKKSGSLEIPNLEKSLQLLAFRDTLDSWFESRLDVPKINWFRCLSLSLFSGTRLFVSFYVLSLPVYHQSTLFSVLLILLLSSLSSVDTPTPLSSSLDSSRLPPWYRLFPQIRHFITLPKNSSHMPHAPCSAIASVAAENSFLPGWVLSPRLCPSPSAASPWFACHP